MSAIAGGRTPLARRNPRSTQNCACLSAVTTPTSSTQGEGRDIPQRARRPHSSGSLALTCRHRRDYTDIIVRPLCRGVGQWSRFTRGEDPRHPAGSHNPAAAWTGWMRRRSPNVDNGVVKRSQIAEELSDDGPVRISSSMVVLGSAISSSCAGANGVEIALRLAYGAGAAPVPPRRDRPAVGAATPS